jgi:hypothetical protein
MGFGPNLAAEALTVILPCCGEMEVRMAGLGQRSEGDDQDVAKIL